ncbi:MAG: GNAT family N-acetyltransferase [Pirellulales bacterium]|jgi:amino-acid N-acetyltransferase
MPKEPPASPQGAPESEPPVNVVVRPVRYDDLENILGLIDPFVEQDVLLPRSEGELIELLATSFVAEDGKRIIGYVSLEIYSIKLAEVRSLAVAREYQRHGIGQRLVAACVDLARRKGIIEVMAITSNEDFFRLCGFDFTLPGEKKALFIHTTES